MSVYYTDFSEYPLDQPPVDWTTIWSPADITWAVRNFPGATGNRILERTGSWTLFSGHVWNTPGQHTDSEVLTRFRVSSVSAQIDFVCTRASGTVEANANNYSAIWLGGTLYLGLRTNGVLTVLSSMSFSMSAGSVYWARLRSNGSLHQLRVWLDGSNEPGTPMLSAVDSTHTSGLAGVMSRQDYTYEFDFVSVATNGDIAASTPPNRSLRSKLMITR